MIDSTMGPYGIMLLRLTTGVALIAHSLYLKIFVFTMAGTASFFKSLGLPEWMVWIVLIVEIITGTMLVLGIKPRLAALAAVPVLLGATWAHFGNGWLFSNSGGGWEYPLFWTAALVAIALLGDGAHALLPTTHSSESTSTE